MGEKGLIHKFIRIALLTSPLLALFAFTPSLFLPLTTVEPGISATSHAPAGKITGVIFLSLMVLLLWAMNIGWYMIFRKKSTNRNIRLLRYLLSFMTCFLLLGLIFLLPPPPHLAQTEPAALSGILIPFIGISANNGILLIIMDLLILRDKQQRMEKQISDLKITNLTARNEQLKGQIHPHFLFNSLSALKSLMKSSPTDAEKYLLNLSGYLRAAVSYAGTDDAILENEIKYCSEYLEMQKVRFGSSLNYQFGIPDDIRKRYYLPVFSLQMLAENAIKHNALTREEPLKITFLFSGNGSILVQNNLNLKNNVRQAGLGLDNLSKRVSLLSDDKKDICIRKTESTFTVEIPLLEK